jgi:hypothetical protein
VVKTFLEKGAALDLKGTAYMTSVEDAP